MKGIEIDNPFECPFQQDYSTDLKHNCFLKGFITMDDTFSCARNGCCQYQMEGYPHYRKYQLDKFNPDYGCPLTDGVVFTLKTGEKVMIKVKKQDYIYESDKR